jgi:hypothetical protein
MTVNRYLFQSPSSSQVQIGRLDPSVKQEDTSSSTQLDTSSQKSQVNPLQTQNTTAEVEPTVSSDALLDVYA